MTLHASWIHGNALTVENPENLDRIGHFGWGADMSVQAGKGSWFHIPVPSPVIVEDVRMKVQNLFLLFDAEAAGGKITRIHVWDGASQVEVFDEVNRLGHHLGGPDAENTITLTRPHTVIFGMSISFFFQAGGTGAGVFGDATSSRLIVGSAGGDFTTSAINGLVVQRLEIDVPVLGGG